MLERAGHSAYAVGGCVRDSLLGRTPKDWDICTSALPEQIRLAFPACRTADTGLKHGTVTLLLDHTPYEVTTYRVDGAYSDRRRPDSVSFSPDLRDDLSRRDFTVNAMAYHPQEGLVDCFEGLSDLREGVIRCVGHADERFEEDALRILRALRFASVLNFRVEAETAQALRAAAIYLNAVAAERVSTELSLLLTGLSVTEVLLEYVSVLEAVLPEIGPAVGFLQHNPYHDRDVWSHIATAVGAVPPDPVLRLTMLLHDLAKPGLYFMKDSIGHFYGHQKAGADMAQKVLERLKYDRRTINAVTELVLNHDIDIPPDEKRIKRRLNQFGEARLRQLIAVHRADMAAKAPLARERGSAALDAAEAILDEIIRTHECFSIRGLAVSGKDLLRLGIPEGPAVGQTLSRLLESVTAGELPNEKEALLREAERQLT